MFTKLTRRTKNILKITIATIIAIIIAIAICSTIPSHIEQYYCSQMLEAIKENDMEKLQNALEKGNPNSVLGIPWIEQYFIEWSRRTPLQEACRLCNFEMVKLLVESGADVNYYPVNAEASGLYFAARTKREESLDIVRYLVENGAVATWPNPVNNLFLGPSSPPNVVELLRELTTAGFEIDKDDFEDACRWKHEEVIRYLIEERGFDASNPRFLGAYCAGGGDYSYETLEYFLQRGANPYAKDEEGKCAMDYLRKRAPEWEERFAMLAKKYGFD